MIIHTERRDRFVIVSKIPLEDERLSWKAKGLHAYLLSKPDTWKVIVAHLVRQGPDGKASVMAALKELEDAGYIVRKTRTKLRGRYDGIDCDVYEEPHKTPDETASENQPIDRVRFSDAENRTLVKNEELKNDLLKKEENPSISIPVDLAEVRRKNDEIFNRKRAS